MYLILPKWLVKSAQKSIETASRDESKSLKSIYLMSNVFIYIYIYVKFVHLLILYIKIYSQHAYICDYS